MSTKPPIDIQADVNRHPKGPRYDVFFANAFSIRMGDNDCVLRFMLSEDPGQLDFAELQTAVALTPRSVKVLLGVLLDSILDLEHTTGVEFPTKGGDRMRKVFEAAKAAWTPEDVGEA